jgi:hypothetical protein
MNLNEKGTVLIQINSFNLFNTYVITLIILVVLFIQFTFNNLYLVL